MTKKLKPVHIDCTLFAVGTFCSVIAFEFSSDSTYNYVDKQVVFWTRVLAAACAQTCLSLITFRNKSYAKSTDGQPAIAPQPPAIPVTQELINKNEKDNPTSITPKLNVN